MSASDWLQLLASPGHLGELYGEAPPSPDSCELFYVHIDERGDSVTLGFGARVFPSSPPPEWQEKGFNAFEFYLVFTNVEGLRVSGWGPFQAKEINLETHNGERVEVTLGRTESGIEFQASSVSITKTRAYLASDSA